MTAAAEPATAPSVPSVPLRVAHIVRPAQGGMVTQVRTLIAAMPEVHTQVAASAKVLQGLQRSNESDLVLPDDAGPGFFVPWGCRVGRWAKRSNIGVLHGHGISWAPLLWIAANSSRLPYVLTLHNLLPKMTHTTGRATLHFFLSHAKRLIAVSEAVADGARALLGPDAPVTTIPNGIDLRHFDNFISCDRAAVRARLGLSDAAPVALCVARLSPEKNVNAFIEAAAKIVQSGDLPQPRFLVAGDGRERSRLTREIDTLGLRERVTLLGARDDVPALLRAADVVCIPSRSEGFGLVAIEAMAAGRPVVATSVGGLPEVIVDGETGLLVNENQIADALSALLTDTSRARAMGAAGRARVEARYDAAAMARATRAVYDGVLAR